MLAHENANEEDEVALVEAAIEVSYEHFEADVNVFPATIPGRTSDTLFSQREQSTEAQDRSAVERVYEAITSDLTEAKIAAI